MVREHIGKIPARKDDSHKGDYGRVLVVAGSRGMTGAAYLCSQGALYSGSGLVYNVIPASLNVIMETKLTEVITIPAAETSAGTLAWGAKNDILEAARKCDVVALGPGLGRDPETWGLIRELIPEIDAPLVIDADGLNALEGDLSAIKARKAPTVLTPHPGEMARLTSGDIVLIQSDRTKAAASLAEETGAVVCLKGHRTVVASPDGSAYVNKTGNSGMATGGTGDVLTGMIASFIGQGVGEMSASVCAVYLHGLAGDIAAEEVGQFSMTASDLLDLLPEAFDNSGL